MLTEYGSSFEVKRDALRLAAPGYQLIKQRVI